MADTPTQAEKDLAIAQAFAALSKGGSPATSAPATQQFLARWNDETKTYDFYKNDNYTAPKPTAPAAPIAGSQYGNWAPIDPANPAAGYTQVVPPQTGTPPNPDEDRSKALKAQVDELRRNELLRNDAAGKGFLTDEQVVTEDRLRREGKVSEDTLKLNRDKWVEDNKRADDKAKLDAAANAASIAKSGAETTKLGTESELNRASMQALGIKTEADRVRAVKAGLLDDAQAEKIKQELLKPTDVTAGVDQQFLMRRDPSGQLLVEPNQNYQGPKAPTTRGELAQRTALLRTQMQQMKDKIAQDQSIKPDQQAARFNAWYDQNVAPQVGALEQQQQAIIQDETQKALELQQKNLTSASTAMQGLMPYRVGPGYGQALEGIVQHTMNTRFPGETGAPTDLGTGWSTFKAPNLDQQIQQLASAQPNVAPGMDFQSLLNRNQWVPGGAPPTPEAMPMQGPAPTPEAMPNMNPNNSPLGAIGNNPMLAAQQAYNRQLASQQTAAATGNPNNSPFGAIGSGGMPLPQAPALAMASGSGPLPYNPAAFSGVMPLLPGYDYTQSQNPYQWPFGGGGGGNSGFTAGP